MRDGRLHPDGMTRAGIDLDDLSTELERDPRDWAGLNADTIVGHVHLHTSDLDSAQRCYHEVLGFDITLRSEDFAALFVSAKPAPRPARSGCTTSRSSCPSRRRCRLWLGGQRRPASPWPRRPAASTSPTRPASPWS